MDTMTDKIRNPITKVSLHKANVNDQNQRSQALGST